jgi:hypothetical protein
VKISTGFPSTVPKGTLVIDRADTEVQHAHPIRKAAPRLAPVRVTNLIELLIMYC